MCGPCGECAPLCNARAGEIMDADRRDWPKRASNKVGEPTHVLVPDSTAVRDRAMHADPHTKANVQAHIEAHGLSPELIERAVETLCDMVGWSSRRLEELEKRCADAVAAERIAANEAAGLRAELDERRGWGFMRACTGRYAKHDGA